MLRDHTDLGLLVPHVPTKAAQNILVDFPYWSVELAESHVNFTWSTYSGRHKWRLKWDLVSGEVKPYFTGRGYLDRSNPKTESKICYTRMRALETQLIKYERDFRAIVRIMQVLNDL